ncbi:class I SAM-dependent methyltransferase [bacterium]|nr:MAG: class I SAM-dependent methyltransferase [bacterium]
MASWAVSPEVQLRQTRFRKKLADAWVITPGSRVLEIGCGQGDTTAVLAHAVGENGRVTATDIASPTYGSPVSLGDSAAHLQASPLGERIDFRFGFDLLDPSMEFSDDAFDTVVMSHCSWYFPSAEVLLRTLARVRPWAKRLCFSEWKLEPDSWDQTSHMLAAIIQGQLRALDPNTLANIRTPLSKDRLKQILSEAGWALVDDKAIDSSGLDDAEWEIAAALDADLSPLPVSLRETVKSQIDVLRGLSARTVKRSLSSYSLVATRE